MRIAVIVAAAIPMLAAADIVAARQIEHDTGSLIGVPQRARIPETGDSVQRGRIALSQFARCTVERRAIQLRKLLMLPAEKANGPAWTTLADSECLSSGEMRFKPMLLRGAVFTELYRRRAGGRKGTERDLAPAAPFVKMQEAVAGDANDKLQFALLEFADCVVSHDRTDASAMIVAPTASPDQDQALQRLMPFLGPCLPEGQIKFSRPVLEGPIAEVLYRGSAQAAPAESR